MSISIIVARDLNNSIGKDNKLLYHIKEDMKRFKELTTGHKVIMGRKTQESLPKGYLPYRDNLVLTKSNTGTTLGEGYKIEYINNIEELISSYMLSDEEVFVIGGDSIYKQFLPYANKIYLTEILEICQDADSYFEFDKFNYIIERYNTHTTNEGLKYSFIDYIRK